MNPDHPPRPPAARTAWLLVAIGAVAFAGASLLVHTGATKLDERLFRFVNDVPNWLADILTPISKLFLPLGIVIVVAAAGVYVTLRNRSAMPLVVAASAAAVAYVLAKIGKAVAQRPRPYEVLPDAVLRQHPAHGTSFPSMHTTVAVATVIALLPFLPRRLAPWAIVYAAMVGWSRMYLGVHYPLDVIAGAGIGLVVGGLAMVVLRSVSATGATPTDAAAEPPPDDPG